MMKVGLVAVLAVLMIVLVAQNTAPVETRLVFVTVTMPRAALLRVTLLVGVVFGLAPLESAESARRMGESRGSVASLRWHVCTTLDPV
jgi:uncharacterized integral membrane protein